MIKGEILGRESGKKSGKDRWLGWPYELNLIEELTGREGGKNDCHQNGALGSR
ncbi:hypothetical protein JQ604_26090 [Bradyrhizobium jicamae]|uniref:hypothetical protein n=1 Tax=Bradyrhizobium jicamae TaxID=280332 RepID=UPI001BAA96E2|nr:hypothetical protein [Bradyrhizobium jicamae]MBR0755660.1 hypothetical protein [Bradyrhizobium jicamae]